MSKLYIIGGGPGAGKTTIAEAISKKYDFEYLKADELVGDHQEEAADKKLPMNNYVNSLSSKEQQIELIKLTARQELTRQTELFHMLHKELVNRKFTHLLIEGNCLLPDLVVQYFRFDWSGVWLVPTKTFQDKIYLERDWAQELIKASGDPAMTLHNWIQRDQEYNETVRLQARDNDLPYMIVDGEKALEETFSWVEGNLKLTT